MKKAVLRKVIKKICSVSMSVLFLAGAILATGCDGVYVNKGVEGETQTAAAEVQNVTFDDVLYSRVGVDEVWPKIKECYAVRDKGTENLDEMDYKRCHNIIFKGVYEQLGAKTYESSDGWFFIDMNGELSPLGYNIVNMVPWDYDEDGNKDLLITSWSGSGIHYVNLWAYNTITKETNRIYGGSAPAGGNLGVTDKAPNGEDISTRRYVYTVDTSYEYDVEEVQLDRGGLDWIYHYKTQSIKNEGALGYVEYKNGKFIYKAYPSN